MGAELTAKDKKGISALHYACGQGRLDVVKFLWSKGVDLDSDDPGACVHSPLTAQMSPVMNVSITILIAPHVQLCGAAFTKVCRRRVHIAAKHFPTSFHCLEDTCDRHPAR